MSGIITWNGVSSDTLGIYVEKAPSMNRPARKMDSYDVPGRNGSIIRMQDAWENVEQSYDIFAGSDARHTAPGYWRSIAGWLFSASGYAILSDDFEPGYYRKAYFEGPIDIENIMTQVGRATITFNCDPRRFLVETVETFTGSGTMTNPTIFTAKPTLRIYGTANGSGTVSVGGKTLSIDAIVDGMVIDGENQNATDITGTYNYNGYITGDWPVLTAGSNIVAFTGDITSIEVTPHFWTV